MISTILRNKTVLVYPLIGIISDKTVDYTYYRTIHVPTISKKNWDSQETHYTPQFHLTRTNGFEIIINSNGEFKIS